MIWPRSLLSCAVDENGSRYRGGGHEPAAATDKSPALAVAFHQETANPTGYSTQRAEFGKVVPLAVVPIRFSERRPSDPAMASSTKDLLPGTEVDARGLRWEVVASENLGPQTLFRLRGLAGAVLGQELDILHPFEHVEPVIHDLRPDRAAPLANWLVYHQAFLSGCGWR